MKGRSIIHRALHGADSNASTEMRITLVDSMAQDGSCHWYYWVLDNDATGHHWFKPLTDDKAFFFMAQTMVQRGYTEHIAPMYFVPSRGMYYQLITFRLDDSVPLIN